MQVDGGDTGDSIIPGWLRSWRPGISSVDEFLDDVQNPELSTAPSADQEFKASVSQLTFSVSLSSCGWNYGDK